MKMKRILALLLTLSLVLSLCACSGQTSKEETNSVSNEQENVNDMPTTTEKNEESGDSSDLEAVGDVNVDKGLFDVTLTIPAEFADESKTQEDYDVLAKENGYKSITLNEEGSLNYVMTKSQHKDLMAEMKTGFQESLDDMIGSEDYPNFVAIKHNDDFTEFEIATKSEELGFTESFSVLAFYMMSGMYNVFNGTEVDNCKVTFINESSGEIISESNSSEMGENSN